jgi:competence protein ComEC
MAAVILAARASGNSQNSVAALATAISTLLLVDPFQALEPGFILSVLATSGLLFIAPHLSRRFAQLLPESVAEVVAVPCAATIACTPYLLVLSGEVSALSIFFNVLVAPVVAPITILGFLALLLMPLEILHTLLIWPAHLLATWITRVASWSEASPTLGVNPVALIVSATVSYLIFRKFGLRSLFIITFLTFGLALIPRLTFPGSNWRIVQCDIGQGDALILNLGGGDAILFDTGPDPRALSKCLKRAGIKRLPLIIISHGHADHYFGAQGLSSRFKVGEIWSNGNPQVSTALDRDSQYSPGNERQYCGRLYRDSLAESGE